MEDREQYVAEGFRFLNETDAKLATKEKKQVEYLQQRLTSDHPDKIREFYDKALNDKVFKTPIGMEYLKQLQTYLIVQGYAMADELAPIPINHPCEKLVKPRKEKELEMKKLEKERAVKKVSLLVNVMLLVAIVVMFILAGTSNHPNVLNYEKTLTNKYAAWEQELSEREAEIREKEREMKQWNE